MPIKFTQYLRPNGNTRVIEITRPAEIEALAQDLLKQGLVFEIEELQTGEVSMSIEDHGKEDTEVIAMEICSNGPEVPKAVDKMIQGAYEQRTTRN